MQAMQQYNPAGQPAAAARCDTAQQHVNSHWPAANLARRAADSLLSSNHIYYICRQLKMPTEFWRHLGAPRTVCAPMVDASELAFRSLVEEHGCDLGYTPMMHGALMGRDEKYRAWQIEENFKEELDARNSGALFTKCPSFLPHWHCCTAAL